MAGEQKKERRSAMVFFRAREEDAAELKELAARFDLTQADVMRRCMRAGIRNLRKRVAEGADEVLL